MNLLITGLFIWSVVHLFPSLAPNARKALITKLGEVPYQALFAVCIVTGIGMIIFGWRGMLPSHVYLPPPGLRHFAMLLVVFGFILMVAANFSKTRVKRFIRHPQLSGVLLWAIAHLIANGDSRSLLLFSVIAIWTLVSMLTINRREGDWQKPQSVMPLYKESIIVIFGVVLAATVLRFHVYLSGVPLIGG